jgi:hypothetical protein
LHCHIAWAEENLTCSLLTAAGSRVSCVNYTRDK